MKNKAPKLRFPEFSGEWEEKRLKNGYELISGQHLNPNEYSIVKNNKPYFTGPSDFTDNIENITKWSLIEGKKAKKGDILFTVKGSGVGTLTILKLSEVVMGRQLMAITSKNSSTLFLSQYLKTKKEYFESLASGNMIPGLSRNDILDLKCCFPLLSEQEKIANFLSSVDIKIEKLEKKKELLEKYKKGMMQKLFSQKLRFKDENDYPEWEEKRLGELIKYFNGTAFPEKYQGGKDKKYPFYKVSDMNLLLNKKEMSISNNSISEEDSIFLKAKIALPETVIFPKVGAALLTNKRRILKKNSIFDNNIMGIIGTKKMNNLYLYYFMSTIDFSLYVQEGALPSISKKIIDNLNISLPSLPEQEKISNFLSSIDRKIELIEVELEKNKEFKKGLLQQMFV